LALADENFNKSKHYAIIIQINRGVTMQLKLNQMPISEKFLMMEQLWESMSQDAHNNGFSPSWHFDVLDAREKRVAEGTSIFNELSEVRKRLQKLV
jgi:hypothetical protein